MMRALLMLLLGLSLSGIKEAVAQSEFAPIGAEWFYVGSNYDFYTYMPVYPLHYRWLDHLISRGDTVYHDVPCKELYLESWVRSGHNPDSLYKAYAASYYVYQKEDTVFAYNNRYSVFTPLYIFNAAEGDTICLTSFHGDGDSLFCFIIDSIRSVNYDGQALRTFYTREPIHDTMRQSYNWGREEQGPDGFGGWAFYNLGKYAEKLGGFGHAITGLFPTFIDMTPDVGYGKDGPAGVLNCYKDSLLDINLEGKDCAAVPLPRSKVSGPSLHALSLSIYPNPATHTFSLRQDTPFPERTTVVLADVAGKHILTMDSPAGKKEMTYHVGHLPAGLYLIRCSTDDAIRYGKLVIGLQ